MSDWKPVIRALSIGALLSVLITIMPTLAAEPSEAWKIMSKAKAEAGDVPEQAKALVRLAWIDDQGNKQAAALARRSLVSFGKNSLQALHEALIEVDIRYTADIVAIMIKSRREMTQYSGARYVAALEQALWVGSVDAKRLAIKEIALTRYRPALLPIIDAATEYPALTLLAMDSLAKLGDDRARFFLDRQLREGDPATRAKAAEYLAIIGNNAIQTLREATLSEDAGIRLAAIEALVPHTTINDLTILHEFVYLHPDDDPRVLALVRDRAILLESLMEQGVGEESDPFSAYPE